MFNLERDIPTFKQVIITEESGASITGNKILILDDFSFKVSSKYGELWESSPNNFMNMLSSSFGLPSGQFALQGVQIWQSTDPIDLSITVSLEMDDDSYLDVIEPTIALMNTTLPTKGDGGTKEQMKDNVLKKAFTNLKLKTLIPPGPNIQGIWSTISEGKSNDVVSKALAHFDKGKNGVYNVKVGYTNFNNVIIKSVEPSFSKEISLSPTKNAYYPSSVELSLEMMTMEIATTNMIGKMFENDEVNYGKKN